MSSRSAVIAAVNPSHATEIETEFWTALSDAAKAREWHLVQVSSRGIPEVDGASTISWPPLLSKLAEAQSDMPAGDLLQAPAWFSRDAVVLHEEWEHRRHSLHRFDPRVRAGLHRMAWLVERFMTEVQPSIVLTTNKIDHVCALFRTAALHHGAQAGLIERSPLDSIWYERDGIFTESEIWDVVDWRSLQPGTAAAREALVANPAGFRLDEASDQRPSLATLPRPVVFCPFDNLLWTGWSQPDHPQRSIDNPVTESPQEAIDELADAVAVLGGSLVVKFHPSCRESARLRYPANTHVVTGALDHLALASDLVACFNTKIAFLSLALGRPTVTLANNPAAASGLTVGRRSGESTLEVLRRGLASGSYPSQADVDAFLTWLDEHYFYGGANGQSPDALLDRVISDIDGTTTSVDTAAIERLSRQARGERAAVRARPMPARVQREEPRRVFLEVSRLLDPYSRVSGIGRYGEEVLRGLTALDSVDAWAVVTRPGRRGWSRGVSEALDDLHELAGGRLLIVDSDRLLANEMASRVGELRPGDVYHSSHLPLPDRSVTGPLRRVVTIHDVLHLKHPELYPGTGRPMIEVILDSIDPARDVVVCDSEQTRRDLLTLHPVAASNTFTVPLGATPQLIISARRENRVVALVKSDVRKNAGDIMGAVADVLNLPAHRSTRFVALLPPEPTEADYDMIVRSGLDLDRTDLVFGPTDEEMTRILRRSRAFVFGSSYEGFGLPLVEAMAAGCPTVTPINSSLVEVAGDSGAYALSPGRGDLADALNDVLSLPGYADELRAAGRRRAAMLTWAQSTARLVRTYEAVHPA